MNISRRAALMMVGGAARGMPRLRAESIGLWQSAAAAGLRFGSTSDVEIRSAPAAYSTAFARHCELLAPNMGWHRVAAAPGATRPSWEDPNIGFARLHAMRLTGGHLLWHKALPDYFTSATAGRKAQALVREHVRMMVKHYAGQVFSWNVVNEAIGEFKVRTPSGLDAFTLVIRPCPNPSGFNGASIHAEFSNSLWSFGIASTMLLTPVD